MMRALYLLLPFPFLLAIPVAASHNATGEQHNGSTTVTVQGLTTGGVADLLKDPITEEEDYSATQALALQDREMTDAIEYRDEGFERDFNSHNTTSGNYYIMKNVTSGQATGQNDTWYTTPLNLSTGESHSDMTVKTVSHSPYKMELPTKSTLTADPFPSNTELSNDSAVRDRDLNNTTIWSDNANTSTMPPHTETDFSSTVTHTYIDSYPIVHVENVTDSNHTMDTENVTDSYPTVNTENVTDSYPTVNTENVTDSYPTMNTENITDSNPTVHMKSVTESHPTMSTDNVTDSNPTANTENGTDSNPTVHEENVTDSYPTVHEENVTDSYPTVHEENVTNKNETTQCPSAYRKLICFVTLWALGVTAAVFLWLTVVLWIRLQRKRRMRRKSRREGWENKEETRGAERQRKSLWLQPTGTVEERVEFWYATGCCAGPEGTGPNERREGRNGAGDETRRKERETENLWVQPKVSLQEITEFWYTHGKAKQDEDSEQL